jgi:predicted amidophosphoribosyltransferase
MYNEYQIAEVKYLNSLKPNELCYCGWYTLGRCPNCPPNKSQADKQVRECPQCKAAPHASGDYRTIHLGGCWIGYPDKNPKPVDFTKD